MLPQGTDLPATATLTLSTFSDPDAVEVVVLRGNRMMSADAAVVGRYRITGFDPRPPGVPQITTTWTASAGDFALAAEENGQELEVRALG